MNIFHFGQAKKLYENNTHPRVLASKEELENLKNQLENTNIGRTYLKKLKEKTDNIISQLPPTQELHNFLKPDSNVTYGNNVTFKVNINDIALSAIFENNQQKIEILANVFKTIHEHQDDLFYRTTYGYPHASFINSLWFVYDTLYHHIDPQLRKTYQDLCILHNNEHLAQYQNTFYLFAAHNTPFAHFLSGIAIFLALKGDRPEFTFEEELAILINCFKASVNSAFTAQGYPYEDMGYGLLVADLVVLWGELLRRAGLFDLYSECPHFKNYGNALLHFIQPEGKYLANTGDHGTGAPQRQFLFARIAKQTANPAIKWLAGRLSSDLFHRVFKHYIDRYSEDLLLENGSNIPISYLTAFVLNDYEDIATPLQQQISTSFCDRERGLVSLRTGWNEDDMFVVLDASQRSPSARGHEHQSAGNFTIAAFGEYFAIDAARYNIEQSCHNVVLIDGKSGRSTNGEWMPTGHQGVLLDYLDRDPIWYVKIDASNQYDACWAKRHFFFVKSDALSKGYLIAIDDINKDDKSHQFWWQLHTSPDNKIKIKADNSVTIEGCRSGNRMDVHFVLPTKEWFNQEYKLQVIEDLGAPSSYKYLSFDPQHPEQVDAHIEKFLNKEQKRDAIHSTGSVITAVRAF